MTSRVLRALFQAKICLPDHSTGKDSQALLRGGGGCLALFDMPNLNRFDILSISIFYKIALSISISISIFSKITISISISISIFLELPYRYRYRYRYFSELPYRYRYRYRYFQLLHIDIDIDIFQKCRYIDNRYVISIYRTGLQVLDNFETLKQLGDYFGANLWQCWHNFMPILGNNCWTRWGLLLVTIDGANLYPVGSIWLFLSLLWVCKECPIMFQLLSPFLDSKCSANM